MKDRVVTLLVSLSVLAYAGLFLTSQWAWEASCTYATAQVTLVYTPGTADDIAATLPADTPCRAGETVGDSWQSIEYRINGVTCTGMVRTGNLKAR